MITAIARKIFNYLFGTKPKAPETNKLQLTDKETYASRLIKTSFNNSLDKKGSK